MSDSVNRQGKLPTFVVDVPSSTDEFGAHAQLADVIARVIRNDHRIKTIGVLGGWGSGKSTVVSLVAKALATADRRKGIHSFTYDAWLHQSDPPRRAFLEALLSFLKGRAEFRDLEVSISAWRKKLQDWDSDTRKTTTTVTPTLTGIGKWYILMLALIPIGLKLIGEGSKDAPLSPLESVFAWSLSLAPLIAIVSIYIAWRPLAWPWTKRFWMEHRDPHKNESILSIVANKHVELKDELSSKSPEPTAIEFQDMFRDIMSKVQIGSRQLVVIVDNLDRLPADEALKFWATIRSFFLGASGDADRPDKSHLPTVVVPIDDKAFSRLYGNSETVNSSAMASQSDIITRSYIEKTFDLVFHVPPPVLSRWHLYLRQRLTQVFGDEMQGNWPHAIGTVYEDWLGRQKLQPAPRSINSFVNNIAVRWVQAAGENIHIGVLAYFVIEQDRIAQDIYAAVKEPNPLLESFDPDWTLSVAALHFGVRIEDANELFMEAPLRSAIASRDSSRFTELASVPGFDRYFFRVLDAAAQTDEPFSAYSAANLLRVIPDPSAGWVPAAWRKIRSIAISTMPTNPFGAGDSDGLQSMFDSCDQAEKKLFIRSFANSLQNLPNSIVELGKGEPFLEAARITIEQAGEALVDNFEIEISGGEGPYATVLQHHVADAVIKGLVPTGRDFQGLIPYLAAQFGEAMSGFATIKVAAAVAVHDKGDLDWDPLTSKAEEALKSGQLLRVSQGAAYFERLFPRVVSIQNRVGTLVSEGGVQGAFDTSWSGDSEESLASVSALILAGNGALQASAGTDWDAKLAQFSELPLLIDAALARMKRPISYAWLASRGQARKVELPLLRQLAARLIERDADIPEGAAGILSEVPAYMAIIPEALQSMFWGNASALPEFWQQLNDRPDGEAIPVLHALIDSEINKALLGKALKSRLHAAPVERWDAAIRSGEEPMALTDALKSLRNSTVTVGPNAYAQLRTLIGTLMETDDKHLRRRWFRVAARLTAAERKTLFTTLRDRLVTGAEVSNLPGLLTIGGAALINDGEFAKKAEPAVLHLTFPLLGSPEGRVWLLEQKDDVRGWLGAVTRETVDTFNSQLSRLAEQGESGASELAAEFNR